MKLKKILTKKKHVQILCFWIFWKSAGVTIFTQLVISCHEIAKNIPFLLIRKIPEEVLIWNNYLKNTSCALIGFFSYAAEVIKVGQKFDFWLKFRFFVENCDFGQHFDLWSKFYFLSKIYIFGQNFDVWSKLRFFCRKFWLGKNLWSKFRCLVKAPIFLSKILIGKKFVVKISILGQPSDLGSKFRFWAKLRCLLQFSIFVENYIFLVKILFFRMVLHKSFCLMCF